MSVVASILKTIMVINDRTWSETESRKNIAVVTFSHLAATFSKIKHWM
jgi:hypothetical protein